MKGFFQRLRIAAYLSAILTIALGGILIAWPMEVTGLICRILGALLVVMGAVYIFGYFVEGRGMLSITGGLIFLLLDSLRDFQMASDAKNNGSERWGMLFLLALLNCVFGVICICDSFGVVSLAVRMLGIALVYDGISNMIIVWHTVQAIRYAAEKIEPVDVDAHEVDE